MKFAWMSDSHLGFSQYGLERRRLDFARALESAVSHAIQLGIKLIVHTGDLLNSNRPGPDSIECLRRIHRNLIAAGARMIVISGNHDQTDPPWPTLLEPADNMLGISVQDYQVFTYEDVRFFCLPSVSVERFRSFVWPHAEVLLCHMQVQEFIGFESLNALKIQELPLDDFNTILIGDIHVHKVQNYPRPQVDPVTIGYTGSTELCSSSEQSEKFWNEVKMENGQVTGLTPHLIATRQVIRRVVDRVEDIDRQVQEVMREWCRHQETTGDAREPILFVEYPSDLVGVMERFRAAFNPSTWVVRFKPVLRPKGSLGVPLVPQAKELTSTDILRSCLAMRSDLLPVAEQLITKECDPNATLDQYIEDRLRAIEAQVKPTDSGALAAS